MKNLIFYIYTLIILNFNVYSQYIPQSNNDNQIIGHLAYILSYNEEHEQAEWVYYYLDNSDFGNIDRTNYFKEDPAVKTGSATLADYKGSGYDRGHLCPAADNSSNIIAMKESFYMSNVSPQHPSLNRGKWRTLETKVRQWALKYEGVHVVTGGILNSKNCFIGENKVTVPDFYYKIVYIPKYQQMIGFILPNNKIKRDLINYIFNVDIIEQITNIDFFPQLNDDLENRLESNVEIHMWLEN